MENTILDQTELDHLLNGYTRTEIIKPYNLYIPNEIIILCMKYFDNIDELNELKQKKKIIHITYL